MASAIEDLHRQPLTFSHDGRRLSGWVSRSRQVTPKSAVVLVPGHGRTDAAKFCLDMQADFAGVGLACFTWDRPGCGASEGTYDHYQSVEESGREAAAGFEAFAGMIGLPADRIGFWGISRAGWICAYAIAAMARQPGFWISVSSGGSRDNFAYLLEQNLRHEGKTEDQVRKLIAQFWLSLGVLCGGGSYEQFLAAIPDLRDQPLLKLLGGPISLETFEQLQRRHLSGAYRLDATADGERAERFFQALAAIRCPVLALFGENDLHVDWREAADFYRSALSAGQNADFTIRTFPGANHGMGICRTGTVREMNEMFRDGTYRPCDREAQVDWLRARGFAL